MSIVTIMSQNPFCTATTLSSPNQLNLNCYLLLNLVFELFIVLFIVCLLCVLGLLWSSVTLCVSRVRRSQIVVESQKSLSLLTNG